MNVQNKNNIVTQKLTTHKLKSLKDTIRIGISYTGKFYCYNFMYMKFAR